MRPSSAPTRRDFLKNSALGTAALGAVGGEQLTAADDTAARSKAKSKIRIGTRINPAWMRSAQDNDLRFLKQIGVDYVDIELDMIQGYRETGLITKEAFKEIRSRFDAVGLKIERANSTLPHYVHAHVGRSEGQREIDNLRKCAEMVVEAECPVFGIQACQATAHLQGGGGRTGWSRSRVGRQLFGLDIEASRNVQPAYQVT